MNKKPVLLDLYCGAGGCARGYQLAGFHVVGVDRVPQPNYCGDEFVRGDALEYLVANGAYFDVFHASPPCQFATALKQLHKDDDAYEKRHINMIPQTRTLMQAFGKPYVIENVALAKRHLIDPIMLCGASFDLKVYRHRLFEVYPHVVPAKAHGPHQDKTPPAGRGVSPKGFISVSGNGGIQGLGMPYMEYARTAMGIDWMSRVELSQAIPPAYTQYIGEHLLHYLQRRPATLLDSLFKQVARF